jgi:hypothetical protein
MSEIEFGRVGKWLDKSRSEHFVFMVICRNPELPMKAVADVLILNGEVFYNGRWQLEGDIGPVALDRHEIEWLE